MQVSRVLGARYFRCAIYNGVAEDSIRITFDVYSAVDIAVDNRDSFQTR